MIRRQRNPFLADWCGITGRIHVQHIESLTPMVLRITGVQVRETVPDWVLQRVNETVMSDLTPEALRHRMERGDIYSLDRAQRALGHFFRPGNLIALRELALRQVAHVVDRTLEAFRTKEQIEEAPAVHERIAVGISSNPAAQYLVARASRMATALGGDLFVVYVDIGADDTPENRRTLEQNLQFAEHLGADVVRLKGSSVAEVMAQFVRDKHITQIVFGRSATTGLRKYLYMSAIHNFLRDAPDVDVHIVTQHAN